MKFLGEPKSGSQAGTTASRNRFGQYYRNRRAPVQPRTAAQLAVRGYLTDSSKAWGGLTDAERVAWNSYALAHPTVDSLGSSITLTGAQLFVSINTLNSSAGLAAQDAPPDGTPAPIPDPDPATVTAAGLDVQSTAGFTGTCLAYSSPPLSSGVNFTNDYRLVAVTTDPALAGSLLTAAQLTTKWGTLVAGQKFLMRFRTVSGGNRSAYATLSVTLT